MSRNVWRRFLGDEHGSTLVESSLVIGTLFVLIFGTVDWSRYQYNRARVRNAVRRGALIGARMGSGTFDSTTVANATRGALAGSAAEQALGTVDVELTGTVGDDARVQVAWMNFPMTRATSLVLRATRADTVSAEFRVEQP